LFIWLIFICPAQASHPVEHAQASLPHCSTTPIEADVVTPSSTDTEEALELLSLSPVCGPHSRFSEHSLSSDNDLFKDWPEANDMAVSVYIALTADALNSHTSTASVIESIALMAHLPDDLTHGRRRRDGPASENLGVLVLLMGGPKGQRLTLSGLLQLPHQAMVCFPLLISTDLIETLCSLALSKKASLVLLTV
jgi:hypothetical protein